MIEYAVYVIRMLLSNLFVVLPAYYSYLHTTHDFIVHRSL